MGTEENKEIVRRQLEAGMIEELAALGDGADRAASAAVLARHASEPVAPAAGANLPVHP